MFRFRSRRIHVDIPVSVSLQERDSERYLTGKSAGTIINISKGGVRLVVEQILFNGEHLFFTSQRDAGNYVVLLFEQVEEVECRYLCSSVWMDSYNYRGKQCFKIGLQFLVKEKVLYRYCKKHFRVKANADFNSGLIPRDKQ